jgi:molecular chaperone DnaK
VPQVDVTFDIDANGIVSVSAKDKATGKEQQIRIQASSGLSDADIERMVSEAESHAEEDQRRRKLAEARNQAEGLIHTTDKNLKEFGDKVAAEDRSAIEQALEALKAVKDGDDTAAITAKSEAVAQLSLKLGEAMYKSSQETETAEAGDGQDADAGRDAGSPQKDAGSPQKDAGSPQKDEKVVDADFVEVDDKDKDETS